MHVRSPSSLSSIVHHPLHSYPAYLVDMSFSAAPPQSQSVSLRVFRPPTSTHGMASISAHDPRQYWAETEPSPASGTSDHYTYMRPHMMADPYARYSPLPPAMQHQQQQPRSAPTRDLRTPSPTPQAYQTLQDVQSYPSPKGGNNSTVSPRRLTHTKLPHNDGQAREPEAASMRCTDFVAKLWFLLDRPEYSPHIRWNASGESFIFFPTKEFATDVLARLFKHSNVASFVRQLNLYGFQRISHLELLEDMENPSGPSGAASAPASMHSFGELPSVPASGFAHPDFVRGKPGTLGKIRPKPSPGRARKAGNKKRARAAEEDDDEDYQRQPQRRRGGGN